MPAPRTPSHTAGSEIVASLMWGERTVRELAEVTGVGPKTIRDWIEALRHAGVVRVTFRTEHGGSKPFRYALQSKPFDQPDALPEEP